MLVRQIGVNSTASIKIVLVNMLNLWTKKCMNLSTQSLLMAMIRKITANSPMSASSVNSSVGRPYMKVTSVISCRVMT